MFAPLPDKPDHLALELEMPELWEREGTFERLREYKPRRPRFSFVDGPVTANKKLALHTAWGRTLKDVFQRYKALRGFDQRYQNGFDCQGLWIEVVGACSGLNSKREIEEFARGVQRRCREVVVWSSQELTRGSIRLGQWMDWGNDYFTFSDTNIGNITRRLLKRRHRAGLALHGPPLDRVVPRCGTSLSCADELSQDGCLPRTGPTRHSSCACRCSTASASRSSSGRRRPGRPQRTWPWPSSPTRSTAACGRTASGWRWAVTRGALRERKQGAELVGWRYRGPFDELGPGAAVEHRVIPWEDVTLDQGRDRPHRAGLRRRGLRARRSTGWRS